MSFKFIRDDLKPFTITLWRWLRMRVGAGVRWIMRTPVHFIGALVVIVALVFGVHAGVGALKDDQRGPAAPAAEKKSQGGEELHYRQVEARSIGADEADESGETAKKPGRKETLGTSAQAVDRDGPSPSYKSQDVPAPSKPKVNTSKQSSVAEGWAKSYLSRESGDDQWKDWTGELTNSKLKDYLADAKTPLEGRGDSSVTKVGISKKPFDDAPKDTKLRWSRTVTATVATTEGGNIEVAYKITMMRGEDGWQITDAVEDGWQAKSGGKG